MAIRTIGLLVCLSGFALAAAPFNASPVSAPPAAPLPRVKRLSVDEITHFIQNLSSDDFFEREEATEALKRRPEAAIALIRANRTATHPEARKRLATILPLMMNQELAEKRLDKLPEYVKKRQLDRIVETMVACREFIRSKDDDQIRAFVKDIYSAATGGKKHEPTARDFPTFNSFAWRYRFPSSDGSMQVAERAVSGHTGIIASERIEGTSSISSALALANGDVDLERGGVTGGLVIATGSVNVVSADVAIIVTPRSISSGTGGQGSVLVSGDRVYAFGDQIFPNSGTSIIREHDNRFFSTWKLFSPREIGVSLCSLFGTVRVVTVQTDSVMHRSGVRPGDTLSTVNGVRIANLSEATRHLCRASITWDSMVLDVVRCGTSIQLVIPVER